MNEQSGHDHTFASGFHTDLFRTGCLVCPALICVQPTVILFVEDYRFLVIHGRSCCTSVKHPTGVLLL